MNKLMRIVLTTAVVALLAVGSFATELSFNVPVTVNGKQLDPGKYKVKLTENGGATEVVFYQGKTAVAADPRSACTGRSGRPAPAPVVPGRSAPD
jgi:hypothetical protein